MQLSDLDGLIGVAPSNLKWIFSQYSVLDAKLEMMKHHSYSDSTQEVLIIFTDHKVLYIPYSQKTMSICYEFDHAAYKWLSKFECTISAKFHLRFLVEGVEIKFEQQKEPVLKYRLKCGHEFVHSTWDIEFMLQLIRVLSKLELDHQHCGDLVTIEYEHEVLRICMTYYPQMLDRFVPTSRTKHTRAIRIE